MRQIEINLNPRNADEVVMAIQRACNSIEGLTLGTELTMAQYPGSKHWHCTYGKQSGTLEITYWPAENRAWLSVHDNRNAAWVDPVLPALKLNIERWLLTSGHKVHA